MGSEVISVWRKARNLHRALGTLDYAVEGDPSDQAVIAEDTKCLLNRKENSSTFHNWQRSKFKLPDRRVRTKTYFHTKNVRPANFSKSPISTRKKRKQHPGEKNAIFQASDSPGCHTGSSEEHREGQLRLRRYYSISNLAIEILEISVGFLSSPIILSQTSTYYLNFSKLIIRKCLDTNSGQRSADRWMGCRSWCLLHSVHDRSR